jgi:hypothetical protein
MLRRAGVGALSIPLIMELIMTFVLLLGVLMQHWPWLIAIVLFAVLICITRDTTDQR